jgi:hypothetical protein
MSTKTRYKQKLSSSGDYLQIPRSLVKKLGFHAAIFLGELIDHHDLLVKRGKMPEDHRFYCRFKYVTQSIGLSDYQQKQCVRKLKELGLIDFGEHQKKGRHWLYEIKIDKVFELMTGTEG